MTIVRASKDVLAALVLTSLISTTAAQAAAQSANKQEATRPQSTNQIVGASEQKPAEQQTTPEQNASEPKPARVETRQVIEQAAVVPPAPNVSKKNPNTISIPSDAVKAEPKYQERPVISNVKVGSLFGYRSDPFTGRAKFHSGVDIKARWGESVGASQPGVVQFAGWYHGYGYLLIINHGGGVTTHYAHLSSFDVEVGALVERGQIIGRAGSTGRATSPHLHYELRIDGNPVDPFQPLALDASSDYFKLSRSSAERDETTGDRPRRVN